MDFDLEIPSLDLPEPTLDTDGLDPLSALNATDLELDALQDMPVSGTGSEETATNGKPAGRKEGKMADRKNHPAKKPKAARPKIAMPKMPRLPRLPRLSTGAMMPVLLDVLSIIILLFIGGIMYLLEVPLNAVPDLSLTTYVQGIWLIIGCLLVVAILQNVRMALVLTGIDIAMLATIFPTLWLLLNTPMNPLYFFVLGMIVLLAMVSLPLNVAKARKQAAASGKPAAATAAAPVPTGPRTTS